MKHIYIKNKKRIIKSTFVFLSISSSLLILSARENIFKEKKIEYVLNDEYQVGAKHTWDIKQVSSGTYSTAAIVSDGTNDHLYTWGDNTSGQLGLGDSNDDIERNYSPNEVDINGDGIFGNEGTIKKVSVNTQHVLAVTNDGSNDHLYTWGDNGNGQLGLGDNEFLERNSSPNEVDINGDGIFGNEGTIYQISESHGSGSAVITSDKEGKHLYTWGGIDEKGEYVPIEVDANGNEFIGSEGYIKQVSLGDEHAAVIQESPDGIDHLYTWGSNYFGELGLGNNEDSESNYAPNEVDINGDGIFGNEGTIKQVSLGSHHSSVVTNDGTNDHLYTWGWNASGILGLGNEFDFLDGVYSPNEVDINGDGIFGNEGTIKQVSLGSANSSVIVNDGSNDHLYTWGDNSNGQLGLGDDEENVDRNHTPSEVDINQDGIFGNEGTIKQVSVGESHLSVITNDGVNDHLYTWGSNEYGELGFGDNIDPFIPQPTLPSIPITEEDITLTPDTEITTVGEQTVEYKINLPAQTNGIYETRVKSIEVLKDGALDTSIFIDDKNSPEGSFKFTSNPGDNFAYSLRVTTNSPWNTVTSTDSVVANVEEPTILEPEIISSEVIVVSEEEADVSWDINIPEGDGGLTLTPAISKIELVSTLDSNEIIKDLGTDLKGTEPLKITDDQTYKNVKLVVTYDGDNEVENKISDSISTWDYKIAFKWQEAKPTNITPDGFTLKLMADGYNPELVKSLGLIHDGTLLTTSVTPSANETKSTLATYDMNVIGLDPEITYTSDKFEFVDLSGGRIDTGKIEFVSNPSPIEGHGNTGIIAATITIVLLIAILLLAIFLLEIKIKVEDFIEVDKNTLLIKFNKKEISRLILKKELTLYSGDEELNTSLAIESNDKEYLILGKDKEEYIKIENLSKNKTYDKLSFKYNDPFRNKTWRKVKGKFSIKK